LNGQTTVKGRRNPYSECYTFGYITMHWEIGPLPIIPSSSYASFANLLVGTRLDNAAPGDWMQLDWGKLAQEKVFHILKYGFADDAIVRRDCRKAAVESSTYYDANMGQTVRLAYYDGLAQWRDSLSEPSSEYD
jgi:hypothetical protein